MKELNSNTLKIEKIPTKLVLGNDHLLTIEDAQNQRALGILKWKKTVEFKKINNDKYKIF
jgi:hypothetical protein